MSTEPDHLSTVCDAVSAGTNNLFGRPCTYGVSGARDEVPTRRDEVSAGADGMPAS
jgi:hypothetical protein